MDLVFIVWLADVSKSLTETLFFVGVGAVIGSPLLAMYMVDNKKKAWPSVVCFMIGFFMLMLSALLPSKQGFYQIAAAYGAVETVQYLQQSDDAKRIASKSIQAIEKMLDDAIKEDKK